MRCRVIDFRCRDVAIVLCHAAHAAFLDTLSLPDATLRGHRAIVAG